MSRIAEYVKSKQKETLEELEELLRIPSISSSREHRDEMARCAALLDRRLRDAGLDAEILTKGGHPAVYGERIIDRAKPTLLLYGHYDVLPPGPDEKWTHGPFEPTVDGEYLVARGASDDKGQFYALVKGLQAFHTIHDVFPENIKVLLEGEEEIGSPTLEPLLRSDPERFASDVVVIADGRQFRKDVPAITCSLRGLVCLEIVVRGPTRDLHSGSYGGAVANPANALTRMIAACQGPFGKVAIPGFYDGVRELEPTERQEYSRLPFHEREFLKETGAPSLQGEEGYSTLERRWARPTFEVNGLSGGFAGEGFVTVLPSEASARISMRLVPDQDPETIARLTEEFLRSIAPAGVEVQIVEHHQTRPVMLPRRGPAVEAAVRAHITAFGREPVFIREGGSLPVVNIFLDELGTPSLLLGLGIPDDNAHAPDERIRLEDFYRGIVLMASLLEEMGR